MLLYAKEWLADVIGRVLWSAPALWDEPALADAESRENQFLKHSTLRSRGAMGVARDDVGPVTPANLVPLFVTSAELTDHRVMRVGHG